MIVDGFLRARVLPRFGAGHVEEDDERTFFVLFAVGNSKRKKPTPLVVHAELGSVTLVNTNT